MLSRKPIVFLPLIIIFLTAQIVSAQQLPDIASLAKNPVVAELFDNNSNNWILDNQYISGRIEQGEYLLKCKNFKGSTGLSFIAVQFDKEKDFEIEAGIRVIKGSGALVIGMNDKFDHYRVEFNSKNDLFVAKDNPSQGRNEVLLSSPKNVNIRPGTVNKITVARFRNKFYIYVNGTFIKDFSNINLFGNLIGFNTGTGSEISADYINVSYLTDKPIPAIAGTEQPSGRIQIEWISPSAQKTSVESFSARVRTKIISESGLNDVLFYINGVAAKGEPEIRPLTGEPGAYQVEKVLNLNPGENSVYVIASGNEGSAKSELRYFSIPSATIPGISWVTPYSPTALVNKERLQIEVCVQSQTTLQSVEVLVNGIPQSESRTFQAPAAGDCNYRWQVPVVLREGDNEITVIARNLAGSATSDSRLIKRQSSFSEKRLALVLGNSQYGTRVSLKNPVNDANLMEGTLKDLNFEVIKKLNGTKAEMEQAIIEFNRKLPEYNVALFYYAGHGIQVDGVNYLLPVDATLEQKSDCQWQAVSVTDVVKQFEKYPDNINIVILDACRNNPFTNWVRGNEAGFKFLPNVSGTIIGYATVEGATAADGSGLNGLYTEELVKQMILPQPIESVFKRTRVQVELKSNGLQSPQETTGLRGDFYFVK